MKSESRDRLTVAVRAYHEHRRENTICLEKSFHRYLKTSEPHYRRLGLPVGTSPVKLDVGFVTEPGLVLIENALVPSKGMTEEEVDRVIRSYVRVFQEGQSGWIIRPGDVSYCELENHANWFISSPKILSSVNIYVFPR